MNSILQTDQKRPLPPHGVSPSPRRCRRCGFSLVELLLVMAIIAVLATTALGILRDAQEESREAATQALIVQLDSILQQRFEQYEVRKIPARFPAGIDRQVLRQIRQAIVADIINAEMPQNSTAASADFPSAELQSGLNSLVTATGFTGSVRDDLIAELDAQEPALKSRFIPNEQDAEYFFGIIATSDFNDSPGTDLISKQAIADLDGDGLPELVDFWGDPLVFQIQQLEETAGGGFMPVPLDPTTPVPLDRIRFVVSSVNISSSTDTP